MLADNEEICRELLELILDIRIRKVVVNRQEAISITADAKSVRFDVYAEDEDNTVFDVEMETTRKKNLPKRSRYYQGMIDLNIIQKGADYKELKRSYVIFICLKDPFDQGRHLYTFENHCNQQLDLVLGDDTVKVFLNASGTVDDISPELADFLNYLTKKQGETSLVRRIDEEVKKARAHEEWKVEYMTLQMKFHDVWDEGHDAGYDEGHNIGWDKGHDAGYDEGHNIGWDEGTENGKLLQLISLAKKEIISIETAAQEAGMTEAEFLAQMEMEKENAKF